MPYTGTENQQISFDEGGKITKRYRDAMPELARIAQYFSKASIQSLLNQSGAIGIRVYFGYDKDQNMELVIAGVNEDGNDLVGEDYVCIDTGDPSPPNSSAPNVLNS